MDTRLDAATAAGCGRAAWVAGMGEGPVRGLLGRLCASGERARR